MPLNYSFIQSLLHLHKYNYLLLLCAFLFPVNSREIQAHPQLSDISSHATAKQAMVVSDQALATQVGLDILKAGGNAIDAAVAMAYALAVVQPCCGNIGGGGFLLLHTEDGQDIVINFREKAPKASTADMFITMDANNPTASDKSLEGYLAVAVPGTVMGLDTALKRYGTLPLAQIIQPAIQLAEQGFILQEGDIKLLAPFTQAFKKQNNVAQIFLNNNQPYKIGDRLVQKDLSETLKLIQKNGAQAFYKGDIAKAIVQASKENAGILTLQDFSDYTVQTTKPLQCDYRGHRILTMPPPSSGGVLLCEMLNILEHYPLKDWSSINVQTKHAIIDAMRFAFLDRNQLGDPEYVDNPVQKLTSKEYAKTLAEKMDATKKTYIKMDNSDPEILKEQQYEQQSNKKSCCTTHFSVIDNKGNIVALTYTLNSLFGAKVIAGHTGFFLNNEMDDFSTAPGVQNQFGLMQGAKNAIVPGKRPLSSMAPTLVFKNEKPFLILGAAGGPKIITSNLLTLLRVIDYDVPLVDAVNAPRFHHQYLPDEVQFEPQAFTFSEQYKLKKMGYTLVPSKGLAGIESAIKIDPHSGIIEGVSDKRRSAGKAAGY